MSEKIILIHKLQLDTARVSEKSITVRYELPKAKLHVS
jgi:hypothetical protein